MRGTASNALMRTVSGSLITGIITAIRAISLASLIFSGSLATFGSHGIAMALTGALILGIVVSAMSSHAGMIATPQEAPVAILALVSAGIVATMPPAATQEQTFATVMAAIVLTSAVSGIFFLALGTLHLGSLVRYVPYPVVGGFLAATGWLLVIGAFQLMTNVAPDPANLVTLFGPATLTRWLPGMLLAIVLLVSIQRIKHPVTLPGVLLCAVALFYLTLALTHTSFEQASAQGWLLGPFPAGGLWQTYNGQNLSAFLQANWSVLFSNTGNLIAILITSVVGLLLNASAIELVIQRDLNLNRELQAAGVGNFFSGLFGGLVGFHSLSLTATTHQMDVHSRSTGILAALVCGIPLIFSASLLSYLPKMVLGGLLAMLGLSFLVEWLYHSWFRLPRLDYFIIVLIMVVSATFGFLQGVAVGIGMAVVLFVLAYSRVNVIKHALTGAIRQSTFTRNKLQRQILAQEGERIYILELHGFIFFGTSSTLYNRIREAVERAGEHPVRYVLLDFRQVTGLDSSTVFSFVKMKQLAQAHEVTLVLTQLSPTSRRQLSQLGIEEPDNAVIQTFSDLDHGVEWCEDQLIATSGRVLTPLQPTLQEQLYDVLPNHEHIVRLMQYMEKVVVSAGDYLMHQGDESDALYFVESGKVTAQIELPGRAPMRLQTMAGQNVVGEIGLYLGTTRTASVIVDEPSTLYRLTKTSLQQMKEQDPELAAALHEYLARLMAERLAHLTNVVNAVMG